MNGANERENYHLLAAYIYIIPRSECLLAERSGRDRGHTRAASLVRDICWAQRGTGEQRAVSCRSRAPAAKITTNRARTVYLPCARAQYIRVERNFLVSCSVRAIDDEDFRANCESLPERILSKRTPCSIRFLQRQLLPSEAQSMLSCTLHVDWCAD